MHINQILASQPHLFKQHRDGFQYLSAQVGSEIGKAALASGLFVTKTVPCPPRMSKTRELQLIISA